MLIFLLATHLTGWYFSINPSTRLYVNVFYLSTSNFLSLMNTPPVWPSPVYFATCNDFLLNQLFLFHRHPDSSFFQAVHLSPFFTLIYIPWGVERVQLLGGSGGHTRVILVLCESIWYSPAVSLVLPAFDGTGSLGSPPRQAVYPPG